MTSRKKIGGIIAGAGIGAAAAAALRKRWSGDGEDRSEAAIVDAAGPAGAFLEHLAEAVRLRTVSHEDREQIDTREFDRFRDYLVKTYPRVHESLHREIVAEHSLLYAWPGSNPDATPFLLMAHQDVVPVEPGTEDGWEHPPFSGDSDGEFLWGRGTLDDKGSLIAILEAVEGLLADGFEPQSTIFLAFGHDEEIGGTAGAAAVAGVLAERGVRLRFVLDEGGAVARDFFPGVATPIALIGIGEKGYLNVELRTRGDGGHSSVPPKHTAVGLLAKAISAVEENPMPARLAVQAPLLKVLAGTMKGPRAAVLRNPERMGRVIERHFSADPTTDALIRTTAAVTIAGGGVKPNILPQEAAATVNFRIMPGDASADVLRHVRSVVGPGVELSVPDGGFTAEPSDLAARDSVEFALVADAAGDAFPGSRAAPWILMGATDSRYFAPIADQVLRFAPFSATPDDLRRIHGTGERVRLADAGRAVAFYRSLVERAAREA